MFKPLLLLRDRWFGSIVWVMAIPGRVRQGYRRDDGRERLAWLFFDLPEGAALSRMAAASGDCAVAKAARSNDLPVARLIAAGATPDRRRLDNAERILFRRWGVKSAP